MKYILFASFKSEQKLAPENNELLTLPWIYEVYFFLVRYPVYL